MFFKPILSDEAPKYENQKVAIIGKIIEIKYERKYTKLKVLDMNGYIDCITFDPISFEEFKTTLFLGTIRKYRDQYNFYIKRFIYLDEKDELLWRKKFMEFINSEYNKIKNLKNNENKEIKYSKKESYKKEDAKKEENKLDNEEDYENNKDNNKLEFYYDFEEDEEIKNIKKILDIIRNFDEGEGVSFDIIMEYSGLSEEYLNKIIQKLLSEGEIYEYMPKKYKVL